MVLHGCQLLFQWVCADKWWYRLAWTLQDGNNKTAAAMVDGSAAKKIRPNFIEAIQSWCQIFVSYFCFMYKDGVNIVFMDTIIEFC